MLLGEYGLTWVCEVMNNQTRAKVAWTALLCYSHRVYGLDDVEPPQVLVCGLIRNLIHYCKQNNVDFEKACGDACKHFIEDVLTGGK